MRVVGAPARYAAAYSRISRTLIPVPRSITVPASQLRPPCRIAATPALSTIRSRRDPFLLVVADVSNRGAEQLPPRR